MRTAKARDLVAVAIATAGGAGFSPVAPGTCGTIVAVPLAWACRHTDTCLYLGVVVFVAICGVLAAGVADRVWGSHDSQRIVIDEVAGYLVTMALVDRSSPWALAVGFALFRALDIVKPWPIRWLDRNVEGGLGVMIDDLAAGVIAAVILYLVVRGGLVPG